MKKIVYGKMTADGYRNFHVITHGGDCYGRQSQLPPLIEVAACKSEKHRC